jgi:hypothetical protein
MKVAQYEVLGYFRCVPPGPIHWRSRELAAISR